MATIDIELKHAIIEFYREEIRKRYLRTNMRRFDQFHDVSDENVDQLRTFFLEHIYPPVKDRETLDDAINRMRDVIKSPKRLRPIMGAAFISMLKMGTSLPAALSAGNSTLDAYMKARRLERTMIETAEKLDIGPEDYNNRETMIAIIADVKEREVMKLIKDIMALFHALSNTKMLTTAVEFLKKCTTIMLAKPELYTQSEIDGILLGCELVQGGLDLFNKLKPEQFPRIIAGIEEIELDWYYRVKAEAAKA